jgi:competence protein ComEA
MKTAKHTLTGILLCSLLFSALPGWAAEAAKKQVNINSADSAQLALLPRVGPSLAQKILDYRKQNGPFKKADDLMLVRGVGQKTYQLIKPYVSIAGETTLREKVRGSRTKAAKEAAS